MLFHVPLLCRSPGEIHVVLLPTTIEIKGRPYPILHATVAQLNEANNRAYPTGLGFPGGSGHKESACNTGDWGKIPESGRSPGALGNLPDPGIKPGPPALQADSLPSESPGKPYQIVDLIIIVTALKYAWLI